MIGIVALAQGKGRGFDLTPLYNADTFSWSLIFGAVSIAVLSFLGFDGISMLAEENKESARAIGRSMVAALLLAGALFIAQTWIASLLVPNPDELITNGDPGGTAFYDAARVAAGGWLASLTALATAIAWGFANSLVAQAATSRLLYAMARDRQLPSFLAKVHAKHGVPVNATLLVAAVSLGLGLYMASARGRHHPAEHAGELRRDDDLPGPARVRGGALPGPQQEPRLLAAPGRPRPRVRDPGLRRGQRPGRRADPRLRLARHRRRDPGRAHRHRPPSAASAAISEVEHS